MSSRSFPFHVALACAGLGCSWALVASAQPIPELPVLPEAMSTPAAGSPAQLPTVPVPTLTGDNASTLPSPTLDSTVPNPSTTLSVDTNPGTPAAPPIPVSDPDYTLKRLPDSNLGPVSAQRGEIEAGTTIALTVFREMTFQPYQAINTHLQVVNPVVDRHGKVVIPAGSTVWGLFEPVYEEQEPDEERKGRRKRIFIGNRFVGNRVTTPEGTYILQGTTDLIQTRFDPDADVGHVALEGAGYGAAGGLAFGILTGGVGFLPILAGTLAGAATGTTNVDQVVALHPNSVVQMELSQPLIVQ